ncbi:unnamed protein product, partial [Allacma fusca]
SNKLPTAAIRFGRRLFSTQETNKRYLRISPTSVWQRLLFPIPQIRLPRIGIKGEEFSEEISSNLSVFLSKKNFAFA